MNRTIAMLGLALTGLLGLSSPLMANADEINVLVNGETVTFEGIGPRRLGGRVMVPLRGVLEKLGAHVGWDKQTQTVIASRGNMDVELPIGSRTAKVNGREVVLDVPARIIAGSTMVPLRFVGETLGADVGWDNATQTVMITTNGQAGGGGVVTQPPRGDNPGNAAPAITSLTHNQAPGWLRAGETLRVTLHGTPGSEATCRIPGVVEAVSMQETSPGVYQGQWTPPAGKAIQITGAALLGRLARNGHAAPLMQAGQPVQIDTVGPRIEDLTPQPNSTLTTRRPLISATFSDQGGSGIETSRIRVTLDQQPVMDQAEITGKFFSYRPSAPLSPARHRVDVGVFDKAGNVTYKKWSFDLSASQNGIKSVSANTNQTLEPGDVLEVRMEGVPGGKATFTLGGIRNRAMTETKPGVYTASYTIRKGDDIANVPVQLALVAPDGERFTSTTERPVQVATGPPVAPKILSPKVDTAISNPLVVRGTAAPNSTVRLKIEYANPVLGGSLALRGTAAQVDVPVDKNGNWVSNPIDVSSLFNSRDTKYTITAVAISPNDEQSLPTTLQLTRR